MDKNTQENLNTDFKEKLPDQKQYENSQETEIANFETISKSTEVSDKKSLKSIEKTQKQKSVVPPQDKKEIEELEEILSAGLDDIYQELSLENKNNFKQKGEEAASKIQLLMLSAKIKFNDILEIIRNWLLVIPGVNRFFLEQEAKIKTDKIISWHDHTHHQ